MRSGAGKTHSGKRLSAVVTGVGLLLIGMLAPGARGQNRARFQQFDKDMQIQMLMGQISGLQEQYADLTMQIQNLTVPDNPPPAAIAPPVQSPELIAATKAAADAASVCDELRKTTLAPEYDTQEYRQAQDLLESDQTQVATAQIADDPDALTALANKILADKTQITNLEQQALAASPQWKNADAQRQMANQSLQTLREKPPVPIAQNSAPPKAPEVVAKLKDLNAQRDAITAQIDPLMNQLAGMSSNAAQVVAEQKQVIIEEYPQIIAAKQRPGDSKSTVAPVLHFSSKVSPQLQQSAQQWLAEQYKLHDPVYAAQKAREQKEQEYKTARENWAEAEGNYENNMGPDPGPEPQPPP